MNREQLKFVFTSVSGNVLEWYDFALYGYFATVIAKLFFPSKNEFISLMITFSVFASGFIARPLGGILFGHIGDKYGRRIALVSSIALIMIPTTLIGLLPSYSAIGIAAPVLLTILRILQGIAVSGELTGSGTFLIECVPEKDRGFFGSLIMCSTYFGLMFGAAISALISWLFTAEQMIVFAWRIPFLISFFLGIVALLLRIQCKESIIFAKVLERKEVLKVPIFSALKYFFGSIIYIFLVSSALAVAIYLLIGYFPSYFVLNNFLTLNQSMVVSFIGLLALTICVPIMGKVSDSIGHEKVLSFGAIGFIIFSYLIFYLASLGRFSTAVSCVVLIAIILSPIAVSLMLVLFDRFPANVRYSGVAFGYNMSMAIFGGITPLISMYMAKNMHSDLAPSIYLIVCGVITLFAIKFIKTKNL